MRNATCRDCWPLRSPGRLAVADGANAVPRCGGSAAYAETREDPAGLPRTGGATPYRDRRDRIRRPERKRGARAIFRRFSKSQNTVLVLV